MIDLTLPHNRTGLLAFLSASLGLTSIRIDDSNTGKFILSLSLTKHLRIVENTLSLVAEVFTPGRKRPCEKEESSSSCT